MSKKVYTRVGDGGRTSLLGGSKVSKSDIRLSAYGTIDELNSFTGLLHDQEETDDHLKEQLFQIQNDLFTVGSLLAAEAGFSGFELPTITSEDVKKLETWMDEYNEKLPELTNFVLPSGHKIISLSHVCRTVCRRAEREISAINNDEGIQEVVIPFINRLSDYFFVLARRQAYKLNVGEIFWKPRS